MNPYTGELGDLKIIQKQLVDAGRRADEAVLLQGPEEHIRNISEAVIAARKAASKRARQSRKRNR